MPEIIKIFVIFALSLVAANFALAKLYKIAPKLHLLDYPNRRKVHVDPKPRVGGLGMILAVSLCTPLFIPSSSLQGIYVGIIILALIGYIDDVITLNCWWKFGAQIVAAVLTIYLSRLVLLSFGNVLGLGAIDLGYAAIPITLFCIVGVVNAINMIDGLDGLLGGISLISFISFAILAFMNQQTELLLLSVAFSGALIAFLRYNLRLSNLFMGDMGSLPIGFTFVFLSIAITQKANSLVPPVVPLLILTVPIVDAVMVLTKRIVNGRNPFRADKNHLHHILLRYGFSKKHTVKIILSLSAVMATLGIAGTALRLPEYYLFSFFLIYLAFYSLVAADIKDVLETRLKIKKGKTGYRKAALLTMALIQIMERLRRIKRKHQRYLLRMSVNCAFQGRFLSGILVDIGRGGLSARLLRALRVGQITDTTIQFMEKNRAVRFASPVEVVWSMRVGGQYIQGFRFVSLKEDQAALLKNYLGEVGGYFQRTETPGAPSSDKVPDPAWWTFGQWKGEKQGLRAACSHVRETLEIAEVRCSVIFENGFFHEGFDSIFSNYRRWGFGTEDIPELTITLKNSLIPPPDQLSETIFYHFLDYDFVSATLMFNTETSEGTIGITMQDVDSFTLLRVVEMIETYIATVYLLYLFSQGKGTLIHSSGICENGSGYIFAGSTGNGKSTIARLSSPRTVLCDDLVVLRQDVAGTRKMYGTPFSGEYDSINMGAECKALFFIEKSTTVELVPMTRMEAVVELMKEGVIGNFLSLPDIARVLPPQKTLAHLIDLLEGIPCYKLRFSEDDSFWEAIHGQYQQVA